MLIQPFELTQINSDKLQWTLHHAFVTFEKNMKPYSDIFLPIISIQSNLDKKTLSLNENLGQGSFIYSQISTRTCRYQEVKNVSFSENFA